MFKRDVTRLEDCLERLDECPLGAGALATTTYDIDRFQTAQALGFKKPTDNSMDSVSDRDYAIELLSNLSILMMHLSRFSEEIILWCSWEMCIRDRPGPQEGDACPFGCLVAREISKSLRCGEESREV